MAALLLIGIFMLVLHNRAVGATGSVTSPATSISSTTTPFKLTSIDLTVQPTTVAGMACNTTITITYTATFHIINNGSGGTIQFMYMYTWNNGRASRNASVTVVPGQTTATYSYSISGVLTVDHTLQGNGIVHTTSPNVVDSPSVYPTGTCH